MLMPGTSKVMHACLKIGSSKLFLCDENENMKAPKGGAGGSQFYLYAADVDASHKQAKAAGMKELAAPSDMFWGDRMRSLLDPFGHRWDLATHVRDLGSCGAAVRQALGLYTCGRVSRLGWRCPSNTGWVLACANSGELGRARSRAQVEHDEGNQLPGARIGIRSSSADGPAIVNHWPGREPRRPR